MQHIFTAAELSQVHPNTRLAILSQALRVEVDEIKCYRLMLRDSEGEWYCSSDSFVFAPPKLADNHVRMHFRSYTTDLNAALSLVPADVYYSITRRSATRHECRVGTSKRVESTPCSAVLAALEGYWRGEYFKYKMEQTETRGERLGFETWMQTK